MCCYEEKLLFEELGGDSDDPVCHRFGAGFWSEAHREKETCLEKGGRAKSCRIAENIRGTVRDAHSGADERNY